MLNYQQSYVGKAGKKGRGVFAKKRLKKGEIIEISPFIETPKKDYDRISDSILQAYWYEVRGKTCAIGLGNTSMYNHSSEPNADFTVHSKKKTISIRALRPIRKDEEILIDYGYDWKTLS